MATNFKLKRWQDQVILWLLVSPWAFSYPEGSPQMLNAFVSGLVIAVLAAFATGDYKTAGVVAFFMLTGELMNAGGISKRIINFGMALVGDIFYVGNTDGIVAFDYQPGASRLTGPGRKLVMLAGHYDDVIRNHARFVTWRKTWAHLIECRRCTAADAAALP